MSDLLVALLLQYVIVLVFAYSALSAKKWGAGNLTIVTLCMVFTGIFAGLSFPVLLEVAPMVSETVVESTVSSVEAIKSVM